MQPFKDNFSVQSAIYAKFRPHYPVELFSFLASQVKDHELVWDCGTGNGQAAVALTAYFGKVIATDPSAEQIRNATPHPRVQYLTEKAEQSSLQSHTADMVTVATALHWFDFDSFYPEVRRVLKPGGILAAWAYSTASVNPVIDRVINHYHDDTLGSYWRAENRMVEQEYTTIPFPFEELATPAFYIKREMNLDEVAGYLNTWSATQRYIQQNGGDPVAQVRNELLPLWGDPYDVHTLTWKLTLKVGRVH